MKAIKIIIISVLVFLNFFFLIQSYNFSANSWMTSLKIDTFLMKKELTSLHRWDINFKGKKVYINSPHRPMRGDYISLNGEYCKITNVEFILRDSLVDPNASEKAIQQYNVDCK